MIVLVGFRHIDKGLGAAAAGGVRARCECVAATSTGVSLYEAIEADVPAFTIDVIAGATSETMARVMDMLGASPTTVRRRTDADLPLPDVADHRLTGYLRIAALLRRRLEESGDPEARNDFHIGTWLVRWMRESQAALVGTRPAEMLGNLDGQRVVEELLEWMRGRLSA